MLRSLRARRGFTLVELLVVIGIIALLIAILMPALRRAKEAANGAKCQSNIRVLMQAFILFAQDHKNHLPGNKHDADNHRLNGAPPHALNEEYKTDWLMGRDSRNIFEAPQRGTVWKYVRSKEVYSCPTEAANANLAMYAGTNTRFDYAYFGIFTGANMAKVKQMCTFQDNVTQKSSTVITPIIVQEHPRSINGANMEGGHSESDKMSAAHGGGSYYGALDGSVHFFVERDLPEVAKDAQPNTSRKSWFLLGPATNQLKPMGQDLMWGDWHSQ